MRRMTDVMMLISLILVSSVICITPGNAVADSLKQDVKDPAASLTTFREWTVKRMLSWARPGRSFHPPAKESFEDGRDRYGEIADSVRDVVYDTNERPIFGGRYGRAKTMALILAISLFESGFRKDVDKNVGKLARGDGGKSWCLMQIQLGTPILIDGDGRRSTYQNRDAPGVRESTPTRLVFTEKGVLFSNDQTTGSGGPDLIADRRLCFRAGLRIIRKSFSACRRLPMMERLSAYASGNCDGGREASKKRVGAAIRWVNASRPPLPDADVMSFLKTPEEGIVSTRFP